LSVRSQFRFRNAVDFQSFVRGKTVEVRQVHRGSRLFGFTGGLAPKSVKIREAILL